MVVLTVAVIQEMICAVKCSVIWNVRLVSSKINMDVICASVKIQFSIKFTFLLNKLSIMYNLIVIYLKVSKDFQQLLK